MRTTTKFLATLITIFGSLTVVKGQDGHPAAANRIVDVKTVVVAFETKSDSVIAVPPGTSVCFDLKGNKKSGSDAVDLPIWLAKETALNGLESTSLQPWHIVKPYWCSTSR
jgi:hypothetical protein